MAPAAKKAFLPFSMLALTDLSAPTLDFHQYPRHMASFNFKYVVWRMLMLQNFTFTTLSRQVGIDFEAISGGEINQCCGLVLSSCYRL